MELAAVKRPANVDQVSDSLAMLNLTKATRLSFEMTIYNLLLYLRFIIVFCHIG